MSNSTIGSQCIYINQAINSLWGLSWDLPRTSLDDCCTFLNAEPTALVGASGIVIGCESTAQQVNSPKMITSLSLVNLESCKPSNAQFSASLDWLAQVPLLNDLTISYCDLSAVELSFLDLGVFFPYLQSLTLTFDNIANLQGLDFFSLGNLETLDLSNNYMSGVLNTNLGNQMPQLKSLNLSTNQLIGFLPSSFANLTSLVSLDVSSNYFFSPVPNLSSLQLLSCNLGGLFCYATPSDVPSVCRSSSVLCASGVNNTTSASHAIGSIGGWTIAVFLVAILLFGALTSYIIVKAKGYNASKRLNEKKEQVDGSLAEDFRMYVIPARSPAPQLETPIPQSLKYTVLN